MFPRVGFETIKRRLRNDRDMIIRQSIKTSQPPQQGRDDHPLVPVLSLPPRLFMWYVVQFLFRLPHLLHGFTVKMLHV